MKQYTFQDLLDIMEQLREGCPWDREQTYESLKRYAIEEAYEVVEAVDQPDRMMLADELGDLLLQVVFYAQIGKEKGEFTIDDILRCVCEKMIRRHPHVFGDTAAETSEEVLKNWAAIKKKEKGQKTQTQIMREISSSLPSLMRAQKVQESAAKTGFDWETFSPVLDKLREEVEEFSVAETAEDREEEFGDLLFAAVNAARFTGIQPEIALHKGVDKFIRRFGQMEELANEKGLDLSKLSLQKMDSLWDEVKETEENGKNQKKI